MKLDMPLQTLIVSIALTATLCWSAHGGEAFDLQKFLKQITCTPQQQAAAVGSSAGRTAGTAIGQGPAAKPPASHSSDACKNITVNVSGDKIEMKNNSDTGVTLKVHVQRAIAAKRSMPISARTSPRALPERHANDRLGRRGLTSSGTA
jgi:hypothetical protein